MAEVQHPPIEQRVLSIGRRVGQQGRVLLGSLGGSQLLFVHALALYREDADVGVVVPVAVRQLTHSEIGECQIGLQSFDVGGRN